MAELKNLGPPAANQILFHLYLLAAQIVSSMPPLPPQEAARILRASHSPEGMKYDFSCQKVCRTHRVNGSELWTLTVQARDLPLGFKYGPNARFAELDTKAAKDMLETLENNPGSFIFKNNGMMVVAESIKSEGTDVSIVCNESEPEVEDAPGHGVLNGGHTYKVLQHALQSKDAKFQRVADEAFITLTVGIGIPEEEIWQISLARNTSEKVPLHALRELAGDWTIVKENLPTSSRHLVAFKPNDPEAPDEEYDTTDLVRRLALLNNKMFPAEQGSHPVQAYTSIGTVVKKIQVGSVRGDRPAVAGHPQARRDDRPPLGDDQRQKRRQNLDHESVRLQARTVAVAQWLQGEHYPC